MKRNDFKQEIFDKVSKHLLSQNAKALGADNKCKYRNSMGLKCAAGCLIPDNDYDPRMECKFVREFDYFTNCGYSEEEIELISLLQEIHDEVEVYAWKTQLINLAKEHGLVINF